MCMQYGHICTKIFFFLLLFYSIYYILLYHSFVLKHIYWISISTYYTPCKNFLINVFINNPSYHVEKTTLINIY